MMDNSAKEITKESYQITAKAYASNVASLAPLASIEKFSKLLPNDATIIDIGCGSGRDAKLFNNMGVNVVGIDFSSNLLEIAKEHAPLSTFKLMDMETMDFPQATFDGVWAACSLGHIPKSHLPQVLNKINYILKDKGYFYLALKKGLGEKLEFDERYKGNIQKFWSFYEEKELKEILVAAKFSILECDVVEKSHPYQTHLAFRVFCQK
jgi:ubiquinone/menaquinone biosynthesis C-methylase UbiE